MSTRSTAVWFPLAILYAGLLSWPVSWLLQGSGLGVAGIALGCVVFTAGAVAPVVVLARAFKGRRGRFGAGLRANEGLMSWGYIGAPLGSLLGLLGPGWSQAMGAGLAAIGTGLIVWGMIHSIPVGEPPDVRGPAPF